MSKRKTASLNRQACIALALLGWVAAGCAGGAWKQAVREDTPAGYHRYLREHADSKHAAEARERLEYHKLLASPSLAGLERFQKKYPSSFLLVNLRPALEQASFDSARARGTAAAYREFLKEFPDGKLAERAIGNATYLEARGFGPDPARLRDFALSHPKSDYAPEAERSAQTAAAREGASFDRLGLRFEIDPGQPEARRVRQKLQERIQELAMRAGVQLVLLPDGARSGGPAMVLDVEHAEAAVEEVTDSGGLTRPGVVGVTRLKLRDQATDNVIVERKFEIRVEDKAHVPGTSVLFSGAAPRYWEEFFVPLARWNNDRTLRPAMKLSHPVVDVATAGDRTLVLYEDGDFDLVDLSDPSSPLTLAHYDRGENYKKWSGVRVVGDRVAIFGEEGLELVRLDRGVPVRERTWGRGEIGRVLGLAAMGQELVLVGAKGMQVLDPKTGTIRRALRRVVQGIAAAGNALVFADGESVYVSTLDLVVDERVIAQLKLGRTFAPSHVRVVDRTAIVTGPGGVLMIDVSVAERPRVVGKLFSRETGEVFDATRIAGRVYLVGQRGLQVLTPRLDGVEETVDVGARRRIAAMGRHLVTADGGGLQVVDATPWSDRGAMPAAPAASR